MEDKEENAKFFLSDEGNMILPVLETLRTEKKRKRAACFIVRCFFYYVII